MTAMIRLLIEHAQMAMKEAELLAVINAIEGPTEYKTQIKSQNKQEESMWKHNRK